MRVMAKYIKKRAGFTLVELALVIVIISLIIGVILGGKTLINAAELRAVMTDSNLYITAINNFKQQYRYLPGDFNRASSYWNGASDGDGNGRIDVFEPFYVWRHLVLAGFIEGAYTGARGSAGPIDFVYTSAPTVAPNIPAGQLKNSGYAFSYIDHSVGDNTTYITPAANALVFGSSAGSNNGPPVNVLLSPPDSYTIDTKMDDGMPGTGKWVANMTGGGNFNTSPSCTTSTSRSDYAGNYQLSTKNVECSFVIYGGW